MAAASPRFHRTPEDRFADLPGYAFAPHYLETAGLRMHYLDEGSGTAGVMLLLTANRPGAFSTAI